MNLTLESPINTDYDDYGSELFTFNKSELKKRKTPSSDWSLGVRCTLGALSTLGFGVSTTFATLEQTKTEPLKNRSIYILCCFFAGAATAIFYHTVLPERLRRKADYYLSATSVESVFFSGLVYRNIHSKRDKEIMHGAVFAFLFGFHLTRNILSKLSLNPADFDQSNATDLDQSNKQTEKFYQLYPMFFPNTRDLKGSAIMLSWYGVVCLTMGGLYGGLLDRFTDDLNDIGVYNNCVAALVGGFTGLMFSHAGAFGVEKFEQFYKTVNQPSRLLQESQRALRGLTQGFSVFSSTMIGAMLQILKGLHSSFHKKWQIKEAANSSLSFALMIMVGAIYTSQYFLKSREQEVLKSLDHEVKVVEFKEMCSKVNCGSSFFKSCKKVFDLIFPYFLFASMMATFGAIVGMTHSDVIRGTVWGIEVTFILMGIATLYFGNRPYEPLVKETKDILVEWKTKCTNALRFVTQSPETIVPLYMYFTNKFPLDDSHLKNATSAVRGALITGLIFWALAYAQYRILYRSRETAPQDVPYLALMQLSNFVVEGILPQGNHT